MRDDQADFIANLFEPYKAIMRKTALDLTKVFKPIYPQLNLPRFQLPPTFVAPRFDVSDVIAASGLTKTAEDITRTFVASELILEPFRRQFSKIDWSTLIDTSAITVALKSLEKHLPTNWNGLKWSAVAHFIEETGWSIVWLPRTEVAKRLLDAAPGDRVQVLQDHRSEILEDADSLLSEVEWAELQYLADCTREAIATLRDGHNRSAQSLLAAILTGLLQGILNYEHLADARTAYSIDWREESFFAIRFALITSTIPNALTRFYPGDPVPTNFHRHATSHLPHPSHLTDTNAIVGLLLVTSLLREIQELHDRDELT